MLNVREAFIWSMLGHLQQVLSVNGSNFTLRTMKDYVKFCFEKRKRYGKTFSCPCSLAPLVGNNPCTQPMFGLKWTLGPVTMLGITFDYTVLRKYLDLISLPNCQDLKDCLLFTIQLLQVVWGLPTTQASLRVSSVLGWRCIWMIIRQCGHYFLTFIAKSTVKSFFLVLILRVMTL